MTHPITRLRNHKVIPILRIGACYFWWSPPGGWTPPEIFSASISVNGISVSEGDVNCSGCGKRDDEEMKYEEMKYTAARSSAVYFISS